MREIRVFLFAAVGILAKSLTFAADSLEESEAIEKIELLADD